MAGDVLKAKCGACIRIELVNRATAESVSMQEGMDDIRLEVCLFRPCLLDGLAAGPGVREPRRLRLQMCILDGKEYAALQDGRNQVEAEVTCCNLLVNNQASRPRCL